MALTNDLASATTEDAPNEDVLEGTAYRAIARLGAGGMGEVFEAEHRRLGTRVVVKLIHAKLAENAQLVDRLRLEAQTLAQLAPHPHLVAVTDLGETPGRRPYYAMERLAGHTLLAELRERGVIPVAQAIEWTRQALSGLKAAHDAGLVHRDVKLDNLFLAGEGDARAVKVLDFGIAKVVDASATNAPKPLMVPTDEGLSVGTPRFFSPEQALGKKVDARSDIYATGIVLYTMLAGRGPFDHANDMLALARAHVGEAPAPPSALAPQPVPEALDRAVLKALSKRPEERFQTAKEFSDELSRILEMLPTYWSGAKQPVSMAAVKRTVLIPTVPKEVQDAHRAQAAARAATLEKEDTTTQVKPVGAASPREAQGGSMIATAAAAPNALRAGGPPLAAQPQPFTNARPVAPPIVKTMNVAQVSGAPLHDPRPAPVVEVRAAPPMAMAEPAPRRAETVSAKKRAQSGVAPAVVIVSAIAFALVTTLLLLWLMR